MYNEWFLSLCEYFVILKVPYNHIFESNACCKMIFCCDKGILSNFRGKDYTQFKDDKKMHVFLLFKVGQTSLPLTSCIVKREQFSAFRFKSYIHTLKGLNKLNWKKLMETIDFNINELLVLFWIVQFICNWFCKDPWFHFSKQQ